MQAGPSSWRSSVDGAEGTGAVTESRQRGDAGVAVSIGAAVAQRLLEPGVGADERGAKSTIDRARVVDDLGEGVLDGLAGASIHGVTGRDARVSVVVDQLEHVGDRERGTVVDRRGGSSGGGLGGCSLGGSGISGGLLSSSLLGVGGLDGGDLVGDALGVGCGGRLLSRSGLLLSSKAVGLVLGSGGVSSGLLLGGLGSLGGLLVLVRERVLDLVKQVH